MARIAGTDIPDNKRAEISLTYLYGIGKTLSNTILKKANINPNTRVKDLSDAELNRIRSVIDAEYKVEGQKRQETFQNIKRLKEIKCYRGIRHRLGLPVRGQRTRCNAHTRKGRSMAVGGLKRIVAKT